MFVSQYSEKLSSTSSRVGAEVQHACEDHVEKQKRAQLSLVHRAHADTGAAILFRSLLQVLPSSGRAQEIRNRIARLDAALAKRTPDDRHKLRMRALYIDINEAGSEWSTPRSVTAAEAGAVVEDAANDYSVLRDRLTTPGILEIAEPDLAAALAALGDRPDLPAVRRPGSD